MLGRLTEAFPLGVIAVFTCTNLFFAQTHQIYTQNLHEYVLGFDALASHYLLPAAGLIIALTSLGHFMREQVRRRYCVFLLAFGILLWVQGSFLTISYGALDGRSLDFASHDWRTYYEVPIWLGVTILFLLNVDRIFPLAAFSAGTLLLLQGLFAVSAPGSFQGSDERYTTRFDDSFYRFSGRNDILHILLDDFGSLTFQEILDADVEIRDELTGFTLYSDAVGSFSTTYPSLAAAMTGKLFAFDEPLTEFLRRELGESSIDIDLRNHGYDTQLASTSRACPFFTSPCKSAMNLDGNYASISTQAAQLLGMGLYRSSPHLLKQTIYGNGKWFSGTPISENEQALQNKSARWARLFDVFVENIGLSGAANRPVYRFIHMEFPHPPYVFNRHCERIERQDSDFTNNVEQARCATKKTRALLARMKTLGLYNETTILIHADHGSHYEVRRKWSRQNEGPSEWFASRSSTLLLFKPPNSHGELVTSKAQVTLTDIKPTLRDIAGLQINEASDSLLNADENRARTRFHWGGSVWQDPARNPQDAKLYRIEGDHLEPKNWIYMSNSAEFPARYKDGYSEVASRGSDQSPVSP
ncbi:MAG: sulfatase-like hydrolase/transferase [Pseudomonadota bacterium]